MGKGIGGEFTGFTLNNIHSSELGITRVSESSRYSEDLLPTFKDISVEIPGGDGMYYFGSYYNSKPFVLSIAYDSVEESQIREMKRLFGTKDLVPLIFDERNYKYYMVKASQVPNLKYICFETKDKEGNSKEVYKGEGTIYLNAYYPYAKSVEEINLSSTTNSLLFEVQGDLNTDFILFSKIEKEIVYSRNNNERILKAENITPVDGDSYIKYNSKTQLLEGCDLNYEPTGTLYNKYITGGDFFNLELGEQEVSCSAGIDKLKFRYLYY